MKLFIISRDETQRVMTTRQSKSKYEIEMLMENDVYAEIASRQARALVWVGAMAPTLFDNMPIGTHTF